ncbi:MAG: retroviral-like aspartic protease family protein [Bacteroidales bacterium]|nr:retroviral-like aspartic protease family protein [Bacteroidales bacterium]
MQTLEIENVNGHMLVDNGQGYLLIDTGSPVSFHMDGQIIIDEKNYPVETSVRGVSAGYISEKVGVTVRGLVGTDIIGKVRTLVDIPSKKIVFNCYEIGKAVPSFNIMGCYGIELSVNGKAVRMLLDTGAPTSYASRALTAGKESVRTVEDFSPFIGNDSFTTPIFTLETSFMDKTFTVEYGNLPGLFGAVLPAYGVEGIIGMSFFEKFPVILDNGMVSIPADE